MLYFFLKPKMFPKFISYAYKFSKTLAKFLHLE